MDNNIVILSHPHVVQFFRAHGDIDPNTLVLCFVECFERMTTASSSAAAAASDGDAAASVRREREQLTATQTEILQQLREMKTAFQPFQSSIVDAIYVKMVSLEQEYLRNIQQILLSNSQQSGAALLDRQNAVLADKLQLLMTELPNKSREQMFGLERQLLALRSECNLDAVKQTLSQLTTQVAEAAQRQNEHLSKISNNSSTKGLSGETQLAALLAQMYPDAEVTSTARQFAACDFLLRRQGHRDILFENKVYASNVPREEVAKFIRDVTAQKQHAVFLSQNSGIATKSNFQVDLHQGAVLIYVHNTRYCAEKIGLAVRVIDILSDSLCCSPMSSSFVIAADELDDIFKEAQQFVAQKQRLLKTMHESYRNSVAQINEMTFPTLERYLSDKYALVASSSTAAAAAPVSAAPGAATLLVCNVCGVYSTEVKRNFAAHRRRCGGGAGAGNAAAAAH